MNTKNDFQQARQVGQTLGILPFNPYLFEKHYKSFLIMPIWSKVADFLFHCTPGAHNWQFGQTVMKLTLSQETFEITPSLILIPSAMKHFKLLLPYPKPLKVTTLPRVVIFKITPLSGVLSFPPLLFLLSFLLVCIQAPLPLSLPLLP